MLGSPKETFGRIRLLLVAMTMVTACASAPRPAPAAPVNVKIAIVPTGQIEERLGQVEEIVQDNCANSSPSTNTLSRPIPIVHEVLLDSKRALSSAGLLQLSDTVRDVPIGQMIAEKHRVQYVATSNVDTSVNLTSAAHSKVVYSVQHIERWERGEYTITIDNSEPLQDGYLIRMGILLREKSASEIPCPSNDQTGMLDVTPSTEAEASVVVETQTATAAPVTDTENPSLTPSASETPPVEDVMALPLETPDPSQPTPTEEPVFTSIATVASGSVYGVDFVEADTGTDRLIVRDGPGSNFGELTRVAPGTQLKVIDSSQTSEDLWWQVTLPDGREGWVRDRFVAVNGERKPDQEVVLAAPAPQPRPQPQVPSSPAPSSSATALGGNRYRISARGGWQETGIYVNVGNFVDIRYVGGQWRITPQSPFTNHEGYPASKFARNPKPELRSGVLICRIASPTLTAIVEPRLGGFRTGARGNIACRVNDDRLDDNEGALDIEIAVSY